MYGCFLFKMDYRKARELKILNSLFPVAITKKAGSGLVNSIINKLPLECHLPGGYQYAGPGTYLDLKLEKGVKPKNKLDEAAMWHDKAYASTSDLKKRHEADYKLQQDAWKRVCADDANLGEKTNAWLVTNAMKLKRKLGCGLPKYVATKVVLDSDEREKILAATSGPLIVAVRFGPQTKESIMNDITLPLTTYQRKKIRKGQKIKLSTRQLNEIKTGGFLPALLAAVPAVAGVGSLISSAINTYNNKKANDALVAEKIRHNKAMEGKGVFINKRPVAGWGTIKGGSNIGNSLYDAYVGQNKKNTKKASK